MYDTNTNAIIMQIISDILYGGILAIPISLAIVVMRKSP